MADISKPTFGAATLPFPDMATIAPVWINSDVTTLGGKTRRDFMARKYKYTFKWNYMKVAAYNELETVINALIAATFTYGKWPQSATPGVSCLGELSTRKLEAGAGDSSYFSSVTLTLTEEETRL